MTVLGAKDLQLHAELILDGRLKSGRCGAYDYYVRNGRQRWRRHVVPTGPCTAAQQRSRAAFGAASKAWSQNEPLIEKQRDAWRKIAAKVRSRPRLGLSGPLTGQQYFVGRNCAKEHLGSGILSEPPKREMVIAEGRSHNPEVAPQVMQPQSLAQTAWEPHRSCTVHAPSQRRDATRRARMVRSARIRSQARLRQRVT